MDMDIDMSRCPSGICNNPIVSIDVLYIFNLKETGKSKKITNLDEFSKIH
jgi:hypothetical protein